MKNALIFLTVCTIVVLSACNSQVKKERLERIDSLGVHLNYVQESLSAMDSLLLENRLSDIKQTSDWVYDNVSDTLPKRTGMAFSDYLRSKKYLGQASDRYNQVSAELSYSKKQLQTLRTDVKNNFYSDEEFRGYFDTEAESIGKLVSATDELKSKYDMSNKRYEQYKPVVVELVDSIKKVIYGAEPITP